MTDKQIIEIAKTCGFNSGNAGATYWECWEQQLLKFARKIFEEGQQEELSQTKSPVEEAFKRVYGRYPVTDIADTCWDGSTWTNFEQGYNAAYEEKVKETAQERGERLHKDVERVVKENLEWCEENPDKDPLDWLKPQTPEQTEQSLKEAFREAQQTENWKEIQKKIDTPAEGIYDNIDVNKLLEKWEKDPPEFLKFELGQTLYDLIADWWDEIFMNNNEAAVTIESLVEDIEKWLPKEQSAAGSQSLGVEDMVEGFNDCLKKIKRKLR